MSSATFRSCDRILVAEPPNSLRIRPYGADDASSTLTIFTDAVMQTAAADYSLTQRQAWALPSERDPASWHRAMTARNIFVAVLNGEVAGFSDVASDGYIDMLYVAPKYQRQGVATALLAEADRRTRRLGATHLHADASITARPFFESHGFRTIQVQRLNRRDITLENYKMSKPLH